jgi:hypothetical protein
LRRIVHLRAKMWAAERASREFDGGVATTFAAAEFGGG